MFRALIKRGLGYVLLIQVKDVSPSSLEHSCKMEPQGSFCDCECEFSIERLSIVSAYSTP
jgi:hypothetical protein